MNLLINLRNIRYSAILTFSALLMFWTIGFSPVYAESRSNDLNAGNSDHIFYKGNTFYEQGKYDEAIQEYNKLIAQGKESGNLYFNMGNSYFKKGELGRAILNYERAKKLNPRDSDLKSNYIFVRSKIKGADVDLSRPFPEVLLDKLDNFTINEITKLLSAVYILIVVLLITRIFIPNSKKYCYPAVITSLIILTAASFSLYSKTSLLDKEAVILIDTAEAKFEPLDNATTHYIPHEGMKAYIIQSKKEWVKIKRPDGKIGWIRDREIERI